MTLKFELNKFTNRSEPIECALFVIHEPHTVVIGNNYRGTAAMVILKTGEYCVGVTLCSPNDQFVKSVGRAKAVGRAFQRYTKPGEITHLPVPLDDPKLSSVICDILRHEISLMRAKTDSLEV